MLTPAAHLTCVAATRAEVDAVIGAYAQAGVRHIVALRGDPLGGAGERYAPHPGGYRNAADLVAGIKRIADIEVSVSAYPEKHPDSPSVAADIDMLKAKVDAGATRAITQFFFENDLYFRYLDRVRAAGIDIPIVPGILPVQNFKTTNTFAARCGASVPAWLADRFDGLDDDAATRKLIAAAVAAEQVLDLVDHGVTDFHFYTMNRADLVYAICHLLGLRPAALERHRPEPLSLTVSPLGRGSARSDAAMSVLRSTDRNDAAPARRRAHSGARRRHGHHDPGARPRRGRLSRRALRCLEPRGARQQRSAQSQPAGRHARHPSRLFPRRRRHRLDQHVLLDPHRAGRLRHGGDRLRTEPRRRAAGARSRAACAQDEDGRQRFVAGAIGPTNRTASISPDVFNPSFRSVTFDELRIAYTEQVRGLLDGGVDALLIETIFDTLNAKAAIFAIAEELDARGIDLPVMISGTITDRSGRMLSGPDAGGVLEFGRACRAAVGRASTARSAPRKMRAHIAELGRVADTLICAYPNAGLPNEFGHYDEGPDAMAALIGEFAEAGLVNIVGGCCGTTPDHIRAIAHAVAGKAPRAVPDIAPRLRLSGLEAFTLTPEIPFVNIGERTNVTGSARFRKLITAGDYTAALAVARDQVENGAQIIDVNMDEGLLDSEKAMITFLNLIAAEPDIARVPVMIDSSKFSVIEAGLKCVQGKAVVNSISLKEGEDAFIRHARLVRRYGAAVVVMAFDEAGQADTLERKTTICARAYDILVNRVGFPPQDIIFDPNIFAVATGMEEHNGYGVAFIEAARWIRAEPAARPRLRRRLESLVLVPRQRAGARGDAFGVPLSRHRGRHGHGHRQCRPDGGL